MYTMFELDYNENNGLTRYSIVINGPVAYVETTPDIAQTIINALNGYPSTIIVN